MLLQFRQRNARLFVEIFKVRQRYQLVQIFQTNLVLSENYHVISRQLLRVNTAEQVVQISELGEFAEFFRVVQQALEDFRKHSRVVNSTVMIKIAEFVFLSNGIKLVVFQARQSCTANSHGIDKVEFVVDILPCAAGSDKRCIKIRVMCDKHAAARKFYEFFERVLFRGRVFNHFIGNSRDFGNLCGNWHFRIYKSPELVDNLAVFDFDCTDFGYPVGF